MNDEPLVTVNILSFNRKDELRNTLTKVYEQDYKNIEVIVVDNASSDGSAEMVKLEFPSVQLIQMEKNIGIAGWNEGFKVARGEYVLVLDDDSYPDNNTIEKGLNEFSYTANTGIIAYNVFNLRYRFSETELFAKNPFSFNGCGALIKREVISNVGYYNELFFIYLNELDFTARCYDLGYKTFYSRDIYVYHNQSLKSRGVFKENPFISEYRYKHYFLGMFVFLYQYFDLKYFILYFLKWILNRLIICIKYSYYKGLFISSLNIFRTYFKLNRKHVLSKSVQEFYKYGNIFPLVDRDHFPNFQKPQFLLKKNST